MVVGGNRVRLPVLVGRELVRCIIFPPIRGRGKDVCLSGGDAG